MKQLINRALNIFAHGSWRMDRTGTGATSYFGMLARYDLMGFRLPIQTTKFVPVRLVIEELLWFLRGDNNSGSLEKLNVNIWKQWAVRPEDVKLTHEERCYLYRQITGKQTDSYLITEAMMGEAKVPKEHGVEVGSLGPVYGVQWRKWDNGLPRASVRSIVENANLTDAQKVDTLKVLLNDGEPDHIDQIKILIDILRNKPYSRRHLITAWNPAVLPSESFSPQKNVLRGKQALPPCHVMFQFDVVDMTIEEMAQWQTDFDHIHNQDHVEAAQKQFNITTRKMYFQEVLAQMKEVGLEDVVKMRVNEKRPTQKLSCILFQRSDDVALGEGFNVPSYAILTRMIAQCVGMAAGEFIHMTGNTHVYDNHTKGLKEQIKRDPYPLPILAIDPTITDIDSFKIEHFDLINYQHHPAVKYDIAV